MKKSIVLAILAALFYAVNAPLSKLLLITVPPAFMASFLYLGAGVGVGIVYLFRYAKEESSERLSIADLPYAIGMIVLDIAAPIFMMLGIRLGTASNASLLGNFETAATTLIALLIFKEVVSPKLWIAIGFITISSALLSFEATAGFRFSIGSLFVIFATLCWGLENNCTRRIADKSTYEIVLLKGIFSGLGSFAIAYITGEKLPGAKYILFAMMLGFVAYGLSIFSYIRAQRDLGAAKTSAFYAIAPFAGSFLAFVVVDEKLSASYLVGLGFMLLGTTFVIWDTLGKAHGHLHTHTITHAHNDTMQPP